MSCLFLGIGDCHMLD